MAAYAKLAIILKAQCELRILKTVLPQKKQKRAKKRGTARKNNKSIAIPDYIGQQTHN